MLKVGNYDACEENYFDQNIQFSLSSKQIHKYKCNQSLAQWCSGINLAYYAGDTEFKSHHKRYSFASVA